MFLNPWYSGPGPGTPGSKRAAANGGAPVPPVPPPPPPLKDVTQSGGAVQAHNDQFDSDHAPQAVLSAEQEERLAAIQESLRPGWTVHLTPDGRYYYCK